MKKFAIFTLTLLLATALTACAGNSAAPQTSSPALEVAPSPSAALAESEAPSSNDAILPASSAEAQPADTDTAAPDAESAARPGTAGTGSRILVAYFSAAHTTEGVAEHIADILGADLYEIVPEVPYTAADLDYSDSGSRTTLEMNDPDARKRQTYSAVKISSTNRPMGHGPPVRM